MPGTVLALENRRINLSSKSGLSRKALSFSVLHQTQALQGSKLAHRSRSPVRSKLTARQSLMHLNIWAAGSIFPPILPDGGGNTAFGKGRTWLLKKHEWFAGPNPSSLDLCVFAFFLFQASDFGQVGLDLEAEFEKDLKEVLIFHEASENSFQVPPWSCSGRTKASQLQDPDDVALALLRLPMSLECYRLPLDSNPDPSEHCHTLHRLLLFLFIFRTSKKLNICLILLNTPSQFIFSPLSHKSFYNCLNWDPNSFHTLNLANLSLKALLMCKFPTAFFPCCLLFG